MLQTFKQFLDDNQAWDMFVTGQAGTGKTTGLAKAVQYCQDNDVEYIVCAFTHKACNILRDKLPPNANVATLHSWLKKRPGVNQHATNVKHVDINSKHGTSQLFSIVFIDEYSMVGEQDLMDIRAMQDADYDAVPEVKVCWLGDPNQLPPVGDMQSVNPYGPYAMTLTTIYRQAADNPLMGTLNALVSFIEGSAPPAALPPNEKFQRGLDIVEEYKACNRDKVLLAYTNMRVQELNAEIQGRHEPEMHDKLFCPTTREPLVFRGWLTSPAHIERPYGGPLGMCSKYKTLEHILDQDFCIYASVSDEDGEQRNIACVFGHSSYKIQLAALKTIAAGSNLAIEQEYKGYKAAGWAKANPRSKLARARSKAWRDYLSFNECVVCIDFPHAMTVHKSQGSTYENVFLDIEDVSRCQDFNTQLKLMYVAISRASNKVVTN